MPPIPPIESKFRFAIVMAVAMTASFAARDALAGQDAFAFYSGVLAVILIAGLLTSALLYRKKN